MLATAQMNAYLILLPPWVTALYFAAAMFGLGGWQTALGAHRLDRLFVRGGFRRGGSRFQPILGLDHRPAVMLRGCPISGFHARSLPGGGDFPGQAAEVFRPARVPGLMNFVIV